MPDPVIEDNGVGGQDGLRAEVLANDLDYEGCKFKSHQAKC